MAWERSINTMYDRLAALEQAFDSLLWAVTQGQPSTAPGHSLADFHEASAIELLGALRTARETMTARLRTTLDGATARTLTLLVQERWLQVAQRWYQDWVGYERRHALHEIAAVPSHPWASWACGVLDALEACPEPLYELQQALLVCWQDLTAVSVMVTEAAGQQRMEMGVPPMRLVSERQASNQ